MKRVISLLLAFAMLLPLAACSSKPSAQPTEGGTVSSAPTDGGATAPERPSKAPSATVPARPTQGNAGEGKTDGDNMPTEEPSELPSDGEGVIPTLPQDESMPSAEPSEEHFVPAPSDRETAASEMPSGDHATYETPDGVFVEKEDSYVSDSILQTGQAQSADGEKSELQFRADVSAKPLQKAISASGRQLREGILSGADDFAEPSSETDLNLPEEPTASASLEENTAFASESLTEATTESVGTESEAPSESTAESEAPTQGATFETVEGAPDVKPEEPTDDQDQITTITGYEYALENCHVSGYIGNDLFIIQDFGSLGWNKKGIGHRDGTYILDFADGNGYFSISSMNENMIIVGNPTDASIESLWDDTSSYRFGYLVYDEESKTLVPLFEEDNLRFYTATYFIDGYALVSIELDGEVRFGIINTKGEYVIEPSFGMIHDEINNGFAIAAKEMTMLEVGFYSEQLVGRNIVYSNTLFTNVQHIRRFSYESDTVGLINVQTGAQILPCRYAYVAYLGGTEYFVIVTEGNAYLFDTSDGQLEAVPFGYAFFADGWSLVKAADTYLLRDEEGKLYSTESLYGIFDEWRGTNTLFDYFRYQDSRVMTNILSSEREEQSLRYRTVPYETFPHAIEGDGLTHKIWDRAHERFIEVESVAAGYGKILYVKDNYVYRLDYDTFESTKLEVGFGGFSALNGFFGDESELFRDVTFKTYVNLMGEGIYNVRIEQRFDEGSSWFDVIINEYGEIILDVAVNFTYRFDTNYLGLYDKALYEIAGNTDMKDNYFITRNDGRTCVLQFVRKEVSDREESEAESTLIQHPDRTISDDGSSIYVSPFIFNFANPASIEITYEGAIVPASHYVYDPTAQTLKFHPFYLDELFMEAVRNGISVFSFSIKAGDETATVYFHVKAYNYQ